MKPIDGQPDKRHTRHGFTAIELLVATTLASALLAAVAGVLGSISAQRKALLEGEQPHAWEDRLEELVRQDFKSARRMAITSDQIRLVGYGGRDFYTLRPTLRPTEIVYSIEHTGFEYVLLRREIHLDDASNTNWREDLVCQGVRGFKIENLDNPEMSTVRDESTESARFEPVPNRLRFTIEGSDNKGAVLISTITRNPIPENLSPANLKQ